MHAAALAACAKNIGRLWEVHDGLFALNPLTEQSLTSLAVKTGIANQPRLCSPEDVRQQVLDERNIAAALARTLYSHLLHRKRRCTGTSNQDARRYSWKPTDWSIPR